MVRLREQVRTAIAFVLITSAILAALLTFGCGTTTPSGTSDSGGDAAPAATAPAPASTPQAAAQPTEQSIATDPSQPAFDPARATKVPKGMSLSQYVNKYYAALKRGDFASAYAMIPASKKQSVALKLFKQAKTAQRVVGFTVTNEDKSTEAATVQTTVTLQIDAPTNNGSTYVDGTQLDLFWHFQKSGSDWYAVSSDSLR